MSRTTPVTLPQDPASMKFFLSVARKRFPDIHAVLPDIDRLEDAARRGAFPGDAAEFTRMRQAWMQLQDLLAGGIRVLEPDPRANMETLTAGEQGCAALALCQSLLRDEHPLLQVGMISTHVTERMAQLMRLDRREFDARTVNALIDRIHREDLVRLKGLLDPLTEEKRRLFRRSMDHVFPDAEDLAAAQGDKASATMLQYYRERVERISDLLSPTDEEIEVLRKAHAMLHVRLFRLLIPYDAPQASEESASAQEITLVPPAETWPGHKGNGGSGAGSTSIFNVDLDDTMSMTADARLLGASWCLGAPVSFVPSVVPLIRI